MLEAKTKKKKQQNLQVMDILACNSANKPFSQKRMRPFVKRRSIS